MKLRRVLYCICVVYLSINTIYITIPFIMTFARIPAITPFFNSVLISLIAYRLINMTYLHMLFDLILIIVGIRSYIKQNNHTRFFTFTVIVIAMNFSLNLIWTFVGYFYSVQ